jgi:hypothetical protein
LAFGHFLDSHRAGSVVTAENKGIFAGGLDESDPPVPVGAVTIYNAANNQWSQAAQPLPHPRYGMATATVGTVAIFAGGYDFRGRSGEVDMYDVHADKWLPSFLLPFQGTLSIATVGKKVIVTGDSRYSSAFIFDVSNGGFYSDLPTGAVARTAMAVTTVGTKAIFAGGRDSFGQPKQRGRYL